MKTFIFFTLILISFFCRGQVTININDISLDGVQISQIEKRALSQLFGTASNCTSQGELHNNFFSCIANLNYFTFDDSSVLNTIEVENPTSNFVIESNTFSLGSSISSMIISYPSALKVSTNGEHYLLFVISYIDDLGNIQISDTNIEIAYSSSTNLIRSISYFSIP
ncbi:hypothetical protein LX97_01505 [Nonlabens dokdonensis]|jgi:hypothetical protein|uniref:Uncharacterized protein n=2 Tax=Nonlabens dokdonensis TaxID=328515 RepID=L7WD95_NONDD|nr:hypothetical protein [Nonlabens dokdonensis]AGC76848.1 hypothetical protein DDD_1721 [Nonlabens dokdonensis DSW-6]PZX44487.1 hypothetical protein LX97_01505 [Nonlabens dokdonensis]